MNLETGLEKVKGVGPKTAAQLSDAGLLTVGDLVYFLPRRHEDFSEITLIADIKPGKRTIKARCENVTIKRVRRGMTVTTAVLADDSGKLNAVWFNQPYRATQLKDSGEEFYFSGEFEFSGGRYQMTNPSAEKVKDMPVQTDRILPIYRAIKGLKSQLARKILDELRPLITMLPETLPAQIVRGEKLISHADALLGQHFPKTAADIEASRQRLAFEEVFALLLASRLNKQANAELTGQKIPFDVAAVRKFVASLPFELTPDQRRAAWDILQDFEKKSPMNRLLQGDVGAGKTVVAGIAALQAAKGGFQTAILAPTEILADQHAETLANLLQDHGVKVALLTGSVKGKKRDALLKSLRSGEIDVLVGTHALLGPTIHFHQLGFVVIDEQHRFGVAQRQELLTKSEASASASFDPLIIDAAAARDSGREAPDSRGRHDGSKDAEADAGKMPHLLSMTATPIPRSLQLTLFGELDISTISTKPKNRLPIKTKIWSPVSRDQLYDAIDREIAKGRQAYVICRLIDENPQNEAKSVEAEFRKLQNSIFGHRKIGLLHGRMKPAEKDDVMKKFANGDYDILVSTTVVEVGVDVPNATVILIEDADQYGLAQLHQLRGRVGRGAHQSYCFLLTSDTKKPSQRLREIEKSNDGFYLAEVDLKLRGPGEIYGRAQHGELNLQIASLADTRLLAKAQTHADWFIASGQNLLNYKELAHAVEHYQRLTTLN